MSRSVAPDRSIIFARPPLADRVGEALTPPLPPDESACAYEACLHDVLQAAARERGRIEVWHDEVGGQYFDDWFPHLRRRPQPASGERSWLPRAFAAAFDDGARRAVVLASDVPALPAGVLGAAFAHLREVDAVLGPARAGAWYLIGLRAAAWPHAAASLGGESAADRPAGALMRSAAAGRLKLRPLPGTYRLKRTGDLWRARGEVAPDSKLGRWLAGPAARSYIDA